MIKNRSEIVFLYDVKDTNPNGDPMDENKPRIDEVTGINIVTDVRLKRSIRDYLQNLHKEDAEILVREIEYEAGKIQDGKMRAEDFLKGENIESNKDKMKLSEMKDVIINNILSKCIDVRLFGVTLPIEKNEKEKTAITLTGPVQFRMGRSLHKVNVVHIKGTGAFASEKGKEQKTFRDEYILPYSLISFYGIINENASEFTRMSEEDAKLLMDSIWNGTKNLISRSKVGQIPRLLLRAIYKEKHYHIGDLDKKIHLKTDKRDEEIRDTSDFHLDITELLETLALHKDKILRIEFELNRDMRFIRNDEPITAMNLGDLLTREFGATHIDLESS